MGKTIFTLNIPLIKEIIRGQANKFKGIAQEIPYIGCSLTQLVKMSDIPATEVSKNEGKKIKFCYQLIEK